VRTAVPKASEQYQNEIILDQFIDRLLDSRITCELKKIKANNDVSLRDILEAAQYFAELLCGPSKVNAVTTTSTTNTIASSSLTSNDSTPTPVKNAVHIQSVA
jgi:hypothetical protein